MTFFWRIFLSAWAIVFVSIVLTSLSSRWLPDAADSTESVPLVEQLVAFTADELQERLENDPTTAAVDLAEERALDFAPLLKIYVLDSEGSDVLGRDLPDVVAGAAAGTISYDELMGSSGVRKLYVQRDGLHGYTVVGHLGQFPVGLALRNPSARFLMPTLMIVVSAVVSLLLARFIVLPVRRLRKAGQRVAAGDLSVRVSPSVGGRTDDIALLAHDFDVMTERVEALLKSQQRLMRDVSHELRSPLARLQALLSISRQNADSESASQIDRMELEIERLDELIGEILTYTRLEAAKRINRCPTDLVDLVQNIVDYASLEGHAAGKEIVLEGPARRLMNLDSGLIQRAVENVIRNAVKYTAPNTMVDVTIEEQSDSVRIVVDDHGFGVPEEAIDRIFEPFFRVDESRSAHSGSGGIGLAIAERSIRLHGGSIWARNRDAGGLRVVVEFPV
ncbi:MAG: ATP-binding protein [Woeseiaceae bacterium]|nr:ATP-binding protein [Woeseiaceae bacterium]